MEAVWPRVVHEAKFNKTLRQMRSRIDPAVFWQTYDRIDDVYDGDVIRDLTMDDMKKIAIVYRFRSIEKGIQKCKKEFGDWLKNHPEFFNVDVDVMVRRMTEKLSERNMAYGFQQPCPCVNWLPEYGGILALGDLGRKQEREWYKNNVTESPLQSQIEGSEN